MPTGFHIKHVRFVAVDVAAIIILLPRYNGPRQGKVMKLPDLIYRPWRRVWEFSSLFTTYGVYDEDDLWRTGVCFVNDTKIHNTYLPRYSTYIPSLHNPTFPLVRLRRIANVRNKLLCEQRS